MKHIYLLLSAVVLSSCLGDDNSNLTYYDDTAITAFSLGTLKRTMHTTSSTGEDSTYTASLSASGYYFFIDQTACEIYNPDSLPIGTNNSKVVCSITTKNSGVVMIKNIDSDTLSYYSSSDSIDFSSPREIRAYSLSGLYYRAYTVSVNVHQEDSTEFNWIQLDAQKDILGNATGMKALCLGGRVYVFCSDGSATEAYYADESDGTNWYSLALDTKIARSPQAYDNVLLKGDTIYTMCDDGTIMRSADGETWETVTVASIDKLVGYGGEGYLYGLSSDGIMVSQDYGKTWRPDLHDDDIQYLPTENVFCFTKDLATNEQASRVILVGSRSYGDYPSDTIGVTWSKIEEYAADSEAHSWIYHDNSDYKSQTLPRMSNMAVVYYGDGLLAMGGAGVGDGNNEEAFKLMYSSTDLGLSWQEEDYFAFPDDFDKTATCVGATVDSNNNLWIVCGGTGQVWRGRLNKYAWSDIETSFTK